MTYKEIYKQFFEKTGISGIDYRPCCEMYDVPNINNAIVVWVKDSKIIYIAENTSNSDVSEK